MTTGRFRDGLPHVTLNLLKQNGDEVAVDFVLDTGFDGDLALPAHVVQQLSDAVQGSQFVNLAGGFQRRCPCYEIIWEDDEGEARTLEVLVMDGNPLMERLSYEITC
jgi:predicted aspartyl protease